MDSKGISDVMREERKCDQEQFRKFQKANKKGVELAQKFYKGWRRLDLMEHFFIIQNSLQSHCDSVIFRNNFLVVKSVYGRVKIFSIVLGEDKVVELADFDTLSPLVYEKLRKSKSKYKSSSVFSNWGSKLVYNPVNKSLYIGVDHGRINKYDLKVNF